MVQRLAQIIQLPAYRFEIETKRHEVMSLWLSPLAGRRENSRADRKLVRRFSFALGEPEDERSFEESLQDDRDPRDALPFINMCNMSINFLGMAPPDPCWFFRQRL